ncbi:HAD-IA family hydrolase [Cryobacterium luteum]|uniref:HAD-IA family hydrolase n=1 Tax=Cryobacterium luteum TaxID=1424661 RepID=UPI0008C57FC1|nr:HAD-IA family hydrolase [Cryobacterium luteum]SEM76919.1 sugar-phosphatase [Cryobacterium luteum]
MTAAGRAAEIGSYPVDGLLFDCDGVLVDSDEAAAAAWNEWAVEFAPGFDFDRDIVHGRPARETIAELVPAADVHRADHALMLKEVETAPLVRALAGARELLVALPTGRFTIVTSAVAVVARARLLAAGLPCPAGLVTFDDVARGKPAPDPYRLGAERLGVDPRRAVVFEDADAGVASAKAAHIGLTVGIGVRGLDTEATLVLADLVGIRFDGTLLHLGDSVQLRADPSRTPTPE